MSTMTEENYLKALYMLTTEGKNLSVTELAHTLDISAPTVTDMLKKLAAKKWVHYERYKPFKLTPKGEKLALQIIRKHRLWELFLVKKMGFGWDEVHEIAEQLEHVQSTKLIERMDKMLGYPKFDPHGDPIPDEEGKMPASKSIPLSKAKPGISYKITGVTDHSSSFLKYLEAQKIDLGKTIKVKTVIVYDGSVVLQNSPGAAQITISHIAASNLQVDKIKE